MRHPEASDDRDHAALVARQEADWPPAVVRDVAGWRLRATPGVHRRRSTSARPLDPRAGADGLDDALDAAQRWARQHDQPLAVQVTDRQPRLDAALAARGWAADLDSDVMTAPCGALAGPAPGVVEGLDDGWRAVHAAVEQRDDDAATEREVYARLGGRARFLQVPGAAVALAVDSERHVGVFSVATLPGHRGRGHATALLRAAAQGDPGRTAYLQVLSASPAVRLYASLGMVRAHGYRYRVRASALE